MGIKNKDIIYQNKIFGFFAIMTLGILMIPLAAMQFTSNVNWTISDFTVMGALLFGTSSIFVLTARRIHKKHRMLIGVIFLFTFLWLWIELAVGLFTNWGS